MYAPIIIFVYKRLDKITRLIESLSQNLEAKESLLYIFSDGAKGDKDVVAVAEVREYIDTIADKGLFKEVSVHKSETNNGLAKSIIVGVSKVMKQWGRAIIIEDDNIVAPDFLDYMNRGLDFYEHDEKVWAVSGFSREMVFPKDYNHDVFMMQRMSSYTWASWADRWERTDWDVADYPKFLWNIKKRRNFDRCGADRSLMLDAQMCGQISSWAIRFEYSMVKNGMYSILPCVSRAVCLGNDGSGTHSDKEQHKFETTLSQGDKKVVFERLEMDERIRKEFIKPYARSWKRKIFHNWNYIYSYYKNKRKENKQ